MNPEKDNTFQGELEFPKPNEQQPQTEIRNDENDPLGLFFDVAPAHEQQKEISEKQKKIDEILELLEERRSGGLRKLASRQKYFGKEVTSEYETEKRLRHLELINYHEYPVQGEYEKTEEDLKMVEKINELLQTKLKALGIDKEVKIESREFHFVNHEGFEEMFQKDGAVGISRAALHAVYVDKQKVIEKYGRWALFQTMLHEAVHQMGHIKIRLDVQNNTGSPTRLGYDILKPDDSSQRRLNGFNEAVVERFTQMTMHSHFEEIARMVQLRGDEIRSFNPYNSEIVILEKIMKTISERTGEGIGNIWEKIIKGQFTGEMMHLRVIDEVFGKGSLRILSCLGNSVNGISVEKVEKYVTAYFYTDNVELREKLRTLLLSVL